MRRDQQVERAICCHQCETVCSACQLKSCRSTENMKRKNNIIFFCDKNIHIYIFIVESKIEYTGFCSE